MADTGKLIIGIDLGTSSVKVGLFSVYGEAFGWESERVPMYLLPNGGAEQDPHDWWNAICIATRRLLTRTTLPRECIVALCATTTGAGTVPVDREGNCLMRAMMWLDTRGAEHTRRVAGGVLAGYDPFKLFRWLRLSGGAPFLSGKDGFGHQLYIKHELSDVYRRTYKFLDVIDYVNWRLTGKWVTTADAVVLRWVTDNRNPARIVYDDVLIRWSHIEREKYPDIVPSTQVLGPLLPHVADELGLHREVQVVAGAYDIPAAALGSGAVDHYAAHLYIGTSAWLATHLPFQKVDLLNAMASLPCALPDRFLLIATQEMAGGNLTWLRDHILYHDDALAARHVPDDFFTRLNAVAEQVPPGSRGVIYTPWLFGERAPVDDGWIRAGFHNLSLHNTRADLARAVLEGVALNTRWLLAPVERFCGQVLNPIHIVGGGANSNLWCQIHADVLNRTIRQVKDPVLANARGAALIASLGLGYIRASDVARCVEIQNEYPPNSAHRALYDQRFAEFVELYKQNRKIHERLNRASVKRKA
jgi:xylulokinase